jgi:hypothetical protein
MWRPILHPAWAPPQAPGHPGTVQLPAVGEPNIGVVDPFVVLPQLLALLERDVPVVALPPRVPDDARWPR